MQYPDTLQTEMATMPMRAWLGTPSGLGDIEKRRVDLVEYGFPDERGRDHADHVGHEDEGSADVVQPGGLPQEESRRQSEDVGRDHVREGVAERRGDIPPQFGGREQFHVILQSDVAVGRGLTPFQSMRE